MFALVLNLWIWIGLLMLVMQVPRHHCTTTTDLGNETVTPTSSPPMSTDMQTTEDPTTTINLLVCARSSYVHTYFICHFIRHWSNTNENKMPIKIWILPITYQIFTFNLTFVKCPCSVFNAKCHYNLYFFNNNNNNKSIFVLTNS